MMQVSNYIVINSDKKVNYGIMRLLNYVTVNNRDFQEKKTGLGTCAISRLVNFSQYFIFIFD